MRRLLIVIAVTALLISNLSFASTMNSFSSLSFCPLATATDDPNFCPSFVVAARCRCALMMPHYLCKSMRMLHLMMIERYGTVENACRNQSDTPYQTCVDDWNCYRNGGKDSLGRLCAAKGTPC